VKRAADKLAAFVAARGRAAEDGARSKNPGAHTPFRRGLPLPNAHGVPFPPQPHCLLVVLR